MSKGVKLERVNAIHVAFVELIGPYEEWGKGLMELWKWLESKGVRVVGSPIGLFYDNPTEAQRDKLRSEACLPIEGDLQSEGRFRIKDLPAAQVATTQHNGPPEEYTKTYGTFLENLLRLGYSFDGPPRETFANAIATLRPGMGIRIEQPVSRK